MPEFLRIINRNRIVSVIVLGVIGYHGVGNLVILDENVNAENNIRTLSENLVDCVENISGDRNHPFEFQHDNAAFHTARRNIAWLEQQDISTIQWPSQSPDLYMIEQVWDFMGREIARVLPCHDEWSDSSFAQFLAEHHGAFSDNLYNYLHRRLRAVIRGRGYSTKYWLVKYFHKKDNISICLTFPDRAIFLQQIIEIK